VPFEPLAAPARVGSNLGSLAVSVRSEKSLIHIEV